MTAATMRALVVDSQGGYTETRLEVPRPRADEVLIRAGAGIPGDLPAVPAKPGAAGATVAGEVLLVGRSAGSWSVGDRVVTVAAPPTDIRPGGLGEYAAVRSKYVHIIPPDISFVAAAYVGSAFPAAWAALVHRARLRSDGSERVVVLDAASPSGTAAVQIARWKRAAVVAVADGLHARRLMELGADRVVSHSAPDLLERIRAAVGGATVVVGPEESLASMGPILAPGSRLAAEPGRGPQAGRDDVRHLFKMVGEGIFVPVIDVILPLSEAATVLGRTRAEGSMGSAVVVPDRRARSPVE